MNSGNLLTQEVVEVESICRVRKGLDTFMDSRSRSGYKKLQARTYMYIPKRTNLDAGKAGGQNT